MMMWCSLAWCDDYMIWLITISMLVSLNAIKSQVTYIYYTYPFVVCVCIYFVSKEKIYVLGFHNSFILYLCFISHYLFFHLYPFHVDWRLPLPPMGYWLMTSGFMEWKTTVNDNIYLCTYINVHSSQYNHYRDQHTEIDKERAN